MTNVMFRRWVLFSTLALLLCACAVKVPVLDTDWPDDPEVPERGWFAARYVSDTANQQHQRPTEYLRWVVRFYYGWIKHPSGWVDTTRKVLSSAAQGPESKMARRMQLLGRRIAAEWAKESPNKLIDNHAIAVWTKALSLAAEAGEIDALMLNIARDVDAIFATELSATEVKMARYFPGQDDPPSFER